MIFIILSIILFDYIMEKFKIEGRYYIIHSIANGIIVYNSFQGTLDSYNIGIYEIKPLVFIENNIDICTVKCLI